MNFHAKKWSKVIYKKSVQHWEEVNFDFQTWGQSGAHSLEVGQGRYGLLNVGQFSKSLSTFRLNGFWSVDAHQIGQLWKKFSTLQYYQNLCEKFHDIVIILSRFQMIRVQHNLGVNLTIYRLNELTKLIFSGLSWRVTKNNTRRNVIIMFERKKILKHFF